MTTNWRPFALMRWHTCRSRAGHLRRASGTFLLGIFTAIIMASVRPVLGSFGPAGMLWGVLAAFVLLIVGVRLLKRLGRKMEVRPDSHATGWELSPGTYARALERIAEVSLIPVVKGSRRNVHPDLYDRMIQAGVTPDFSRPARPPRWASLLGLAGLLLAAYVGVVAYGFVTGSLPDALFDPASAAAWKIGAGGRGYRSFRSFWSKFWSKSRLRIEARVDRVAFGALTRLGYSGG